MYKLKLFGNTIAQPAPNANNGILENAIIAVPLKYLINVCKSLKMPLINCKVELKLKWTKHCVLSVLDDENVDVNSDNNIFTFKNTKLHLPVVFF